MAKPRSAADDYDGTTCPNCQAEEFDIGTLSFGADLNVHVPVSCNRCAATWTEQYVLAGYTDLEVVPRPCGRGGRGRPAPTPSRPESATSPQTGERAEKGNG